MAKCCWAEHGSDNKAHLCKIKVRPLSQFCCVVACVLSVVLGTVAAGEDHLSFKLIHTAMLMKRHHTDQISRLGFHPGRMFDSTCWL